MPISLQYITVDDMLGVLSMDKLIELTDENGSGEIGEHALVEANKSAVSDLHLHASKFYTLPLVPSQEVKELVRQLTKCHLYMRREVISEGIEVLYRECMKKLTAITPASFVGSQAQVERQDSAGVSVYAPPQRFKDGFYLRNEE
jgi:phage gp36-like protein